MWYVNVYRSVTIILTLAQLCELMINVSLSCSNEVTLLGNVTLITQLTELEKN